MKVAVYRHLAVRIRYSSRHASNSVAHVLTDAELQDYDKFGYVVVRGNLTPLTVEKYNQNFLDIVNKKIKVPRTVTLMKDISMDDRKNAVIEERTVTKVQNFEDAPTLFGYCKEDAILANVKRLLGPDLYSIHTMLINKPSDLGTGSSRHPPHQDYLYFPFSPVSRMVAAWTALENITEANGCLYVYPGSHKQPLLAHGYPNDGIVNVAYHGIQQLPKDFTQVPVNVEMKPGDTVYFHPLLIHGSGPNFTTHYRKAISCHYCASDVIVSDVTQTLQKELAKELEAVFLKSRGFPIQYSDLFRAKSRYVCGQRSDAIDLSWLWKMQFMIKLAIGQFKKKKRML